MVKLRIPSGYGVTGKSNIGNAAISFYREGNSSLFGNEVESKGVYKGSSWEILKNKNGNKTRIEHWVGFRLLNNRINLVAGILQQSSRWLAEAFSDA